MTDEQYALVVDFCVHHRPPFGPGARLIIDFDAPPDNDQIAFTHSLRDPTVKMGPKMANELHKREVASWPHS